MNVNVRYCCQCIAFDGRNAAVYDSTSFLGSLRFVLPEISVLGRFRGLEKGGLGPTILHDEFKCTLMLSMLPT